MFGAYAANPRNREFPRVPVEVFCTELSGEAARHAIAVDLSVDGLRIQRPVGGRTPRELQIEFEIPQVDEVVWARGAIRFDEVWRVPPTVVGGRSGVVRTSGIQLVAAADRHRRLLREFVMDTWLERQALLAGDDDWAMRASCYMRG